MIKVKRINGLEMLVNPELIESVDAHHNTVISLNTGNKIIVKDSLDEIQKKVISYRQEINNSKFVRRD